MSEREDIREVVKLVFDGLEREIGMNEKAIIKRKVQLKSQALQLIRTEREGLRHQLNLLNLRDFLQKGITKDFDSSLSSQLDCVRFLLDSLSTRLQASEVLGGQN